MNNKTCGECRYYHPIWEHEGVCTVTSDLHKTCDFTTVCAVGGVYPKPPPTNGDKIRQDSDREFAEYFVYESGAMWASTLIVDKTFDTYEEATKATEDYLNALEGGEVASDVLKPCPFCESDAIDVMAWENSTDISCLDCDYTIKCRDCDEEDAVDYWNTRPAADALTAKVEQLEAALKGMCELWESIGEQIPPLLNERRYIHAKAFVGKDTDVLTEESKGGGGGDE